LQEDYQPVEAPAYVLSAIERRLFASTAIKETWWNKLALWRSLALASMAGLVALGIYTAAPQFSNTQTPTTFVAELADSAKQLRVVALYDAGKGELRLSRAAGAPAENRDFELWLIPKDEAAISLGVFPKNANFALSLSKELQAKFDQNTLLAISDEPVGGSPTGQATGAVLAAGQVSKI
jgi:anti-sigma-K factor RskA